MITCNLEKDERMSWSTHMVRIDGNTIVGITDQTPIEAVTAFHAICVANEPEILRVHSAYKEKLDWNHANPGKGRDWPEMRAWDKLRNRLLKEAGVKDS